MAFATFTTLMEAMIMVKIMSARMGVLLREDRKTPRHHTRVSGHCQHTPRRRGEVPTYSPGRRKLPFGWGQGIGDDPFTGSCIQWV